ncbi:MAG: Uma2 family endonuclease [Paracoccaceae bacterium]|nr:Uma2 family endonuclease [Paracoccaceae bacterium]MDE2916903.1 Uma2 family endonuclease [Paracoccaceae bacterium]
MTTTADENHVVGPLGSEFWRIRVSPDLVPKMAREFDWNRLGRRVMIDAGEGIITWMSPSSLHEIFGFSSDEIVKEAGLILHKRVRGMRGTRWKKPDEPANVGLEADAAFYIGDNAATWYAVDREGSEEEILAFEARTPPDLVVEVEATHFDRKKPRCYAELGVREMWQVDARKGRKQIQVEILDLQAPDGPGQIDKSLVLDGLASSDLPKAYQLARQGNIVGLGDLLKEKLAPVNNLDPDGEPDPAPPSFGRGM